MQTMATIMSTKVPTANIEPMIMKLLLVFERTVFFDDELLFVRALLSVTKLLLANCLPERLYQMKISTIYDIDPAQSFQIQ